MNKTKFLPEVLKGAAIALIVALVTWLVTDLKDRIPKGNQFVKLRSFKEVLEKAAFVVQNASQELWVATDVPDYGSKSQPTEFENYKSALAGIPSKQIPTTRILWFSTKFDASWSRHGEQVSEQDIKLGQENGMLVRNLIGTRALDADLPILAFHNLWISRDSKGVQHTVVCWIHPGEGPSKMEGFYTRSDDLAELFKHVCVFWEKEARNDYAGRLREALDEIKPNTSAPAPPNGK